MSPNTNKKLEQDETRTRNTLAMAAAKVRERAGHAATGERFAQLNAAVLRLEEAFSRRQIDEAEKHGLNPEWLFRISRVPHRGTRTRLLRQCNAGELTFQELRREVKKSISKSASDASKVRPKGPTVALRQLAARLAAANQAVDEIGRDFPRQMASVKPKDSEKATKHLVQAIREAKKLERRLNTAQERLQEAKQWLE